MQYNFEWDANKARTNLKKHGVSFEEATLVFNDPMSLTLFDDEASSELEERWVTLGQVRGQFYLVVVHTYHDENTDSVKIRVISARPATKHEIRQYEQEG